MDTSTPRVRAKLTASITSIVFTHLAINAGRRSIVAVAYVEAGRAKGKAIVSLM